MAHSAYIALGTNLGERRANLRRAIEMMGPGVRVLRKSPVYETTPWGVLDQPDFLNQVVAVETDLAPHRLLMELKRIEAEMGREQTVRYGPRIIDLDILFYNDEVIDLPSLTIPHPYLHERAFVLAPLNDLIPERAHPLLGKTVRQMLAEVGMEGVKRVDAGHLGD